MSPPRKKRDTSATDDSTAVDDSANDDATVDESTLRDKLLSVPSHIVEKALLLYALLTASDTPAWVRTLVLAALAYLINPLDAVPDVLPGIGLTDDFAVLALALERASRYITPAVRKRARALAPKWFGK